MTQWRIDYAAEKHPQWLYRLDDVYDVPADAIKTAQTRLEQWPAMIGFRIVPLEAPTLEMIDERQYGKIIDEAGRMMWPDGTPIMVG